MDVPVILAAAYKSENWILDWLNQNFWASILLVIVFVISAILAVRFNPKKK